MIAAITAEGLERSEAATLVYTLTDVLGPRLTGSPAYVEAARWARDRFRDWGLANPRLEVFEFGRGWSLEQLTVEMVAPRYMPLIGYAEAWSPPTAGVLTGTPVYVPFDQAGIPAFTAIKDFRNYDVRTRHTNADLADAVDVGDLQQSAVVLAAIAWHAAMRDEPIPRRQR